MYLGGQCSGYWVTQSVTLCDNQSGVYPLKLFLLYATMNISILFFLLGCFGFDRGKIVWVKSFLLLQDTSVWKAEEINVTFTKSILMVLCHLEYWYSRCPHQTTPIQLNWKLGFYRNIQERTKRFFFSNNHLDSQVI